MPNLTHDEARERAGLIRVDGYAVDLDLTRGDTRFGSVATISFTARSPGASTFVECRPAELRSATLNGVPLDPATLRDGRLPLTGLAERNVLVVDAEMAYTNSSQGLHRFVDPADRRGYVYAALFLDQAPTVFACFDQPDLKAPFDVRVTADPTWVVAGNGTARRGDAPGRWVFDRTEPLATYFVTLVGGPYHVVEAEHDGIPLAIYARASLAAALDAQAPEILGITRACLDRYHELFGVRYPFGAYRQAFVPEFTMGAMENPGCVTFRDEFIFTSTVTDDEREGRAIVIAHEMAHMWFGDLVTMRWWDDLWLNESFAEYLGHRVTTEVTAFTGAWTGFVIGRKAFAYAADQRPSTHPVSADVTDTLQALENFDDISYAKGAAVLKQLVALLGDDAFFGGLRQHFAMHAFGNASLADLLAALGEASGRDLGEWARVWLRRPGISTLRPVVTLDASGAYESVSVVQESPDVLRPHRIRVAVHGPGGLGGPGLTPAPDRHGEPVGVEVDIEPDRDGATTAIPALSGRPAGDVLLLNDGDLTYAKIRLDGADLDRLAQVLPAVADPLARALLWGAAWDMARDAEWPADRFLDLCVTALPAETEVATFVEVLGYARGHAVERWLPPARRDAARRRVAEACRVVMDAAAREPGRQLAGARGLISCADLDDVEWLRVWLGLVRGPVVPAGMRPPAGLVIDAELRWAIVERLATLGAVSADEIEAENARDRTALGTEHAARARASRPDAAAKAAAWASLVDDAAMSTRLLFATAAGFNRPDQDALTDSYVERYVSDLPLIAARRLPQVVEGVATQLFPRYAVDEATLATMARMRDDPSLPPVLRRTLVDHTDELARSVAARALAEAQAVVAVSDLEG